MTEMAVANDRKNNRARRRCREAYRLYRESCAAFISQYLQYVSRVAVPKLGAIMLGFVNVTSPFKARAYS